MIQNLGAALGQQIVMVRKNLNPHKVVVLCALENNTTLLRHPTISLDIVPSIMRDKTRYPAAVSLPLAGQNALSNAGVDEVLLQIPQETLEDELVFFIGQPTKTDVPNTFKVEAYFKHKRFNIFYRKFDPDWDIPQPDFNIRGIVDVYAQVKLARFEVRMLEKAVRVAFGV